MLPNEKRKIKARESYSEAMHQVIDNAIDTHNIATVKESLHKLFKGWVSTPLELSPEERLDMVIHYEFIQEHLSEIESLKEATID